MPNFLTKLIDQIKAWWTSLVAKAESKLNAKLPAPVVPTVTATPAPVVPIVSSSTPAPTVPAPVLPTLAEVSLPTTPVTLSSTTQIATPPVPGFVPRDVFTTKVNGVPLGVSVVNWALGTTDNFNQPLTPANAPTIGIAGADLISYYMVGHPELPLDVIGYYQAYQALNATGAFTVQPQPVGPPLPLTSAVADQLAIYQNLCKTDADKIGYLKLAGDSDLFNYLVTNNMITPKWFGDADYATRSGKYDPTTNTNFDSPPQRRVWEPIPA